MTAPANPETAPTESPVRGLYAIADTALLGPERLLEAVAAALRGGARVIQYRHKGEAGPVQHEQAATLRAACEAAGALFLVNDHVELAAGAGAHGVHLGRGDMDPARARRRLGPSALIGVSCYNELSRARAAVAAGADYVAFGSFYASPVKPGAVRAGPGLLRRARRCLPVPVVAIGGIRADNAAPLIAAGADAVAVISAVFTAADVEAAARRLSLLFESRNHA